MNNDDNDQDGFEQPNYTQAPNRFFDEILPQIDTLAEIKVTLAVIRQTFGFHKQEDALSISQLEALTGLTREAVCDGIQRGVARGTLGRRPIRNSYAYYLIVGNADQSTAPTTNSRQSRLKRVGNADPQKKDTKESNKATPNGVDEPGLDYFKSTPVQAWLSYRKQQPEAKMNMPESYKKQVYELVTEDVARVEYWRRLCEGWLGRGWYMCNYSGLIDAYKIWESTGFSEQHLPWANGNGAKPVQSVGQRNPDVPGEPTPELRARIQARRAQTQAAFASVSGYNPLDGNQGD